MHSTLTRIAQSLPGVFIVFGAPTWTMTKENIREIYGADKQRMLVSIGPGVGAALLAMFILRVL
jgi:hypothetical protein